MEHKNIKAEKHKSTNARINARLCICAFIGLFLSSLVYLFLCLFVSSFIHFLIDLFLRFFVHSLVYFLIDLLVSLFQYINPYIKALKILKTFGGLKLKT